MRSVKVKFKDSQYDFSTSINGTDEEIRAYYVNHAWNVGTYKDQPDEGANWQMCIDIEFIAPDPYCDLCKNSECNKHSLFIADPSICGNCQNFKK